MTSALPLALLLADARLPVGAHVVSGALEAALRGGLPREQVGAYMRTRMRTVVPVEAGTAVVARAVALSGGDLEEVAAAWAARTPARPQREIGEVLGEGLARLARRLWPEALGAPRRLPRPVVLGAIAAATGLPAADLVQVVGYDDAQTVAAALLKLEPGDPLAAAALVLEACAELAPQVPALAALTTPEAIPASGAPQTEDWATAQSVLPRRLFRA